jgi:hypothetical protein
MTRKISDRISTEDNEENQDSYVPDLGRKLRYLRFLLFNWKITNEHESGRETDNHVLLPRGAGSP